MKFRKEFDSLGFVKVPKNKYFGHGIYTYANGDTYVGEWKKDAYNTPDNLKERHGQGTLTKADGTIEKGIWKKGKLIKPKQQS